MTTRPSAAARSRANAAKPRCTFVYESRSRCKRAAVEDGRCVNHKGKHSDPVPPAPIVAIAPKRKVVEGDPFAALEGTAMFPTPAEKYAHDRGGDPFARRK